MSLTSRGRIWTHSPCRQKNPGHADEDSGRYPFPRDPIAPLRMPFTIVQLRGQTHAAKTKDLARGQKHHPRKKLTDDANISDEESTLQKPHPRLRPDQPQIGRAHV